MKLINVYKEHKTKYKEYVVLIETGIFVNVYNDDTAIINKLLNYKIKDISGTYLIGFPSSSINKVLDILRQNKVNYLVLEKDINGTYVITDKYKTNKNNYNSLTADYKKLEYLHKRISYINSKLLDKVKTDDIENILVKIEKIIMKISNKTKKRFIKKIAKLVYDNNHCQEIVSSYLGHLNIGNTGFST